MCYNVVKKEAIDFFSDAIDNWNRLVKIYNELVCGSIYSDNKSRLSAEGNKILGWFQDNYSHFRRYSRFDTVTTFNGQEIRTDPLFNVIYGGAEINNIVEDRQHYWRDLKKGGGHLRAHLTSVKNLNEKKDSNNQDFPLISVKKLITRFHHVANQLKRRHGKRSSFLIEDEYDVQDLFHALLKIYFDDIRKEEYAPSCAGKASRIDFVLKKSGILIEIKKTREKFREKEIGEDLIMDIKKYSTYPGVKILVCFIYDPENWIENPAGLENDLSRKSTETLDVEVIVQPSMN